MKVTNTQDNYLKYLEKATAISTRNEVPVDNLKEVSLIVQQSEFLVPIIGGFSAGKSSLINALVGREVLPVDVNPETELAAEIRYAEREGIHAVKEDGSVELFPLDGFAEVKKKPREYSHLRVYINADVIKAIQPVVLVDMPGFGSAIGAHAEALARYMSKGAYYIATISADEGTIPASMFAELSEIYALGRSVGFVVTKCNLKPEQDVAEVCDHILTSVRMEVQQDVITHQCGFDAEGLVALIEGLDKEVIARQLFAGHVEDAHVRTIEGLQIHAAGIGKSLREKQQAKDSLERAVVALEHQKARALEEVDSTSSEVIARLCVKKVESALNAATPELVDKLKNKDTSGAEQRLSAIVRRSVTDVLRSQMTQYSSNVIDELGKELQGLNEFIADFDAGHWVENIVQTLKTRVVELESQLDRIRQSTENADRGGKGYKAVTTILAVCSSVVVPVLEVVIIFLPEILAFFAQAKIEEKIRESLRNEVLPQVKNKLTEVIPSIVEEQMRLLVESVAGEFEKRVEEKRKILESMGGLELDEHESETALEGLKEDIATLRESAREYVYGGTA